MKLISSSVIATCLAFIHPVLTMATEGGDRSLIAQSVHIHDDASGEQTQYSSVSVERSDLRQPHLLRIKGEMNNAPMPLERVVVKLNGKTIKTIVNNSLELNLAPLMVAGRNEVEVSGTTIQSNTTISLRFTGPHTQVNQQSSGSGRIKQQLVINVY